MLYQNHKMDQSHYFNEWVNYLRVEKGLSNNTLSAYRADLKLFLQFIEKEKKGLKTIRHGDLMDFLWEEAKRQLNPEKDFLKSTLDRAFDLFCKGIKKGGSNQNTAWG